LQDQVFENTEDNLTKRRNLNKKTLNI